MDELELTHNMSDYATIGSVEDSHMSKEPSSKEMEADSYSTWVNLTRQTQPVDNENNTHHSIRRCMSCKRIVLLIGMIVLLLLTAGLGVTTTLLMIQPGEATVSPRIMNKTEDDKKSTVETTTKYVSTFKDNGEGGVSTSSSTRSVITTTTTIKPPSSSTTTSSTTFQNTTTPPCTRRCHACYNLEGTYRCPANGQLVETIQYYMYEHCACQIPCFAEVKERYTSSTDKKYVHRGCAVTRMGWGNKFNELICQKIDTSHVCFCRGDLCNNMDMTPYLP